MERHSAIVWIVVAALGVAGCRDNTRRLNVESSAAGTTSGAGGYGLSGGADAGGDDAGGASAGGMGGSGGVAGMGGMGGSGGAGGAVAVAPDFSLFDVNATSTSYWQPVSPRDHLRQVSGWYFGHAT